MDLGDPPLTAKEERVLDAVRRLGRCTHAELRAAVDLSQRELWEAVVRLQARRLVGKVETFEVVVS